MLRIDENELPSDDQAPAAVQLVVDWEGDMRYRGGRPGQPGVLIVRLTFHVATDSAIEHVRRAVALAHEKYCSVGASLAPDIRITTGVELLAP